MRTFTKEIWRLKVILACIFREVGRSVMDVEFFTKSAGMLRLLLF